jgi:hypothetical protein
MKFHAAHFRWLWSDESILLIGLAGGRVNYEPEARWLYSLRLFLLIAKIEILWTTGKYHDAGEGSEAVGQHAP